MGVQWLPVLWKTEIFLVRACSGSIKIRTMFFGEKLVLKVEI